MITIGSTGNISISADLALGTGSIGYHSKSTKVVDKSPTTGINIVIDPQGKF
jgi:hypothetical protein